LGCDLKEQYKPDDKYKFIVSLSPKEREGKLKYIPYITSPIEADIMYNNPVMRPLPKEGCIMVKAHKGK